MERSRGNSLLGPESNKRSVFQLVVDVVDFDVAVRAQKRVERSFGKLLFAASFSRFEAHLSRALFGGKF